MSDFIEVVADATGQTQSVPREWMDNPVLSEGLTKSTAQQVADGDIPPPTDAVDPDLPTAEDTHAVLDAYAEEHGIDLGEATTKADKVAVIVAAAAESAPSDAASDSGVDLVAGTVETEPLIPSLRSDYKTPAGEEN